VDPNQPKHQNSDHDSEDDHELLNRFATAEAKQLFLYMLWFSFALGVGIGIEVVVSFLEDYPKLHFVAFVLDALGRFLLICDAIVLALAALVGALLAIDKLLNRMRVDVIAIAR
jgi:hypothetical protein